MPFTIRQDRNHISRTISMIMVSARIFVYFIDYGFGIPVSFWTVQHKMNLTHLSIYMIWQIFIGWIYYILIFAGSTNEIRKNKYKKYTYF